VGALSAVPQVLGLLGLRVGGGVVAGVGIRLGVGDLGVAAERATLLAEMNVSLCFQMEIMTALPSEDFLPIRCFNVLGIRDALVGMRTTYSHTMPEGNLHRGIKASMVSHTRTRHSHTLSLLQAQVAVRVEDIRRRSRWSQPRHSCRKKRAHVSTV
jgi:hypothetical protein